jgi:S-adenosylmethionine decarboxylase proenzyme
MNLHELGKHVIATIKGGELNNITMLEEAMIFAAEQAGATVLHSHAHQFEPQGVTAFVVLAESHFAIHTWPEKNSACLDVFTCGSIDPWDIVHSFAHRVGSQVYLAHSVQRLG